MKVGNIERTDSASGLRLIVLIDVRMGLLLQNARQMLEVVRGTFPGSSFSEYKIRDDCSLALSAGDALSCLWSNAASLVEVPGHIDTAAALHALTQVCKWVGGLYSISLAAKRLQFSKSAQDVMSSTASNYNMARLGIGIGLAALATVSGIATVSTALSNFQATGLWVAFVFIAHGLMMFASSYVEEEQHFWYWVSSSWIGWLLLKRWEMHSIVMCDLLNSYRRNAETWPDSLAPWFAALLLILLRVLRVWNQTGQKRAGEPDIARTILPAHNMLLWLLVLVTYLDVIQRLSRRAVPWASRHLATAASIALGIAALGFKVAFTKSDAPELLEGLGYLVLRPMEEASLVAQARAVLTSVAIMAVLTSFPAVYQRSRGEREMKGKYSSKPVGIPLIEKNSRYLWASTRPLHPFSPHPIPNHQHTPFSFARDTIPSAAFPSTFKL